MQEIVFGLYDHFPLLPHQSNIMAATSPIILILGAGSRIGHHVAQAFAAKGYRVALVSRRQKEEDSSADQLNISSDLSDPDSVITAFSKVKAVLGHPSVVIYNGRNQFQYLKSLRF